jgi:hypothetical protein
VSLGGGHPCSPVAGRRGGPLNFVRFSILLIRLALWSLAFLGFHERRWSHSEPSVSSLSSTLADVTPNSHAVDPVQRLLNRPASNQHLTNRAESHGFRPKTSRSRFCPDLSRSTVCRHDRCTICCTARCPQEITLRPAQGGIRDGDRRQSEWRRQPRVPRGHRLLRGPLGGRMLRHIPVHEPGGY